MTEAFTPDDAAKRDPKIQADKQASEDAVWVAPPIGGNPIAPKEGTDGKPDAAALAGAIDQICVGIRGLWHMVAVQTGDPVFEHKAEEMWGYTVVVGYVIKKAKNWEVILLGMAIMSIITTAGLKALQHAKNVKAQHPGAPASLPPAGALA